MAWHAATAILENDQMLMIETEGSWFDMGRQIGEKFGDALIGSLE